jgi:hypothetical protein
MAVFSTWEAPMVLRPQIRLTLVGLRGERLVKLKIKPRRRVNDGESPRVKDSEARRAEGCRSSKPFPRAEQ